MKKEIYAAAPFAEKKAETPPPIFWIETGGIMWYTGYRRTAGSGGLWKKEGNGMLTRRKVTAQTPGLAEIEALYVRAFPENERRPFRDLFDQKANYVETLAFYDAEAFVGFACLLNAGDVSHIIYFAVEESLRDRGYGSEILREIARYREGCRIIVDIERQDRRADNNGQRERRKRFYLRNGYAETGIRYRWHRENYEILSAGGTLTEAEFGAFWDEIEKNGRDAVGL